MIFWDNKERFACKVWDTEYIDLKPKYLHASAHHVHGVCIYRIYYQPICIRERTEETLTTATC